MLEMAGSDASGVSVPAQQKIEDLKAPQQPAWLLDPETAFDVLAYGMSQGFVSRASFFSASQECAVENRVGGQLETTRYEVSGEVFQALLSRIPEQSLKNVEEHQFRGSGVISFSGIGGEESKLPCSWLMNESTGAPVVTLVPDLTPSLLEKVPFLGSGDRVQEIQQEPEAQDLKAVLDLQLKAQGVLKKAHHLYGIDYNIVINMTTSPWSVDVIDLPTEEVADHTLELLRADFPDLNYDKVRYHVGSPSEVDLSQSDFYEFLDDELELFLDEAWAIVMLPPESSS